jgi:hypothetical protein
MCIERKPVINYSHAITCALNAGSLEDAEYLIEAETESMFGKDDDDIEITLDEIVD